MALANDQIIQSNMLVEEMMISWDDVDVKTIRFEVKQLAQENEELRLENSKLKEEVKRLVWQLSEQD